jgi:hypothetical protein
MREANFILPSGARGDTHYHHRRPNSPISSEYFPDVDELETGEPPKTKTSPKQPNSEPIGVNTAEQEMLFNIEHGITPELRDEAENFVNQIMADSDLTPQETNKLLAYVLSVLANSPEINAGKRLELAKQAAAEVINQIHNARPKPRPSPQKTESANTINPQNLHQSGRVSNWAWQPDSYYSLDRRTYPSGSKRNSGRKPTYKDRLTHRIN